MTAALLIAAKDLRQRVRDRSALVVGILGPVAIAVIVSLAIGDLGDDFSASFVVADEDGGPLARTFVDDVLRGPDLEDAVSVDLADTPSAARAQAERGEVSAAFVVPDGFSERVTSGGRVSLEVVGSAEDPIGSAVAISIADEFVAELNAVRLAVGTALAAGADSNASPELVEQAASERLPATVVDAFEGGSDVSSASYYAPAIAIMFLFLTVGLGARSILAERRDGTLSRLLAAPIPRSSFLVGKTLASFVLGLVSMSVVLTATAAMLGTGWGAPLAVAALIVAMVFATTSITMLVITLTHTEEQAQGYVLLVAFLLAAVGGNFVPLSQSPEFLQRLSLLTPNGWALRAFTELATVGGDIGTIVPNLAAMTAFGLVVGAIALVRARKLVMV